MTLGPIDDEGIRDMKERYEALDAPDKKIVEEEEDKLLSTMIYNFTSYMVMMEVGFFYVTCTGHKWNTTYKLKHL